MRIIMTDTYEQLGDKAAMMIAGQISFKADSVLGLATGSTPIGVYASLVRMFDEGLVDFSQVSTINLDEYLGLDPANEQSYAWFMNKHLFEHINIPSNQIHIPNGKASDPEAECDRYEQVIKRLGGVDLQLLGIGLNGHIGFNEPGPNFELRTHVIQLNPSTIKQNAKYFKSADDVPKYAITLGIGTIMRASKVVLIANGEEKADILHRALFGPVTPMVPASILQLHPDLTVIADRPAMQVINANQR